jgi:stage V sporulation protein G
MSNISVEARAYPIEKPQGSTLSFASATLQVDGEDLVAIRGIRVVEGEKGLFVAMPQTQDKNKEFHDVAFPLTGDLRKEMNRVVLDAYQAEVGDRKQSIGGKIKQGKEKASQHTYGNQQSVRQQQKSRASARD